MLWGATLIDEAHANDDKDVDGLVSVLTPVIKAFMTDIGYDMTVQAQQVYGGHGYIEEWGMSQFTRDARIAMIYEGANGVQALDLVGRKMPKDGGKHVMAYFNIIKEFCAAHKGNEAMAEFIDPLKAASKDLQDVMMHFMQAGMKDPNAALAGSTDALHIFGHVTLGLMWAKMAAVSLAALEGNADDPAFYENKLKTARFYMNRWLPMVGTHKARAMSTPEDVMALDAEAF